MFGLSEARDSLSNFIKADSVKSGLSPWPFGVVAELSFDHLLNELKKKKQKKNMAREEGNS